MTPPLGPTHSQGNSSARSPEDKTTGNLNLLSNDRRITLLYALAYNRGITPEKISLINSSSDPRVIRLAALGYDSQKCLFAKVSTPQNGNPTTAAHTAVFLILAVSHSEQPLFAHIASDGEQYLATVSKQNAEAALKAYTTRESITKLTLYDAADTCIHLARTLVWSVNKLKPLRGESRSLKSSEVIKRLGALSLWCRKPEEGESVGESIQELKIIQDRLVENVRLKWRDFSSENPFNSRFIMSELSGAVASAILGANASPLSIYICTALLDATNFIRSDNLSYTLGSEHLKKDDLIRHGIATYAGLRMAGLRKEEVAQIFTKQFKDAPLVEDTEPLED